MHFSFAGTLILPVIPAPFATDRLILEALLSVELLLTCGENEFNAAIPAYQYFVLEHVFFFPLVMLFLITQIPADLVFAPTPAGGKVRYPVLTSHYCFSRTDPAGLTSKPHHAHGNFTPLTWVVLPATGIDFQPQTRNLNNRFVLYGIKKQNATTILE